jgi:isopropylmalate/homocitrate/citramalate synthase
VFFPVDASRAEINWFLDLIQQISEEGHMDALGVVDTFGGCAPHAVPYMMSQIRARIKKPLEAHFHDDFGLGVANTLAALANGGSVAHTTVSGIGERAGNTPMEELVLAMLTMYGIDLGIKTEFLFNLSQLVHQKAGLPVRPNKAVIGPTLFHVESGIIASWMRMTGREHRLELVPFAPELVGQEDIQLVMGKNSGLDSVRTWLEEAGMTATDEQMLDMLKLVKNKAFEKNGLLAKQEFKELAEKVLLDTA